MTNNNLISAASDEGFENSLLLEWLNSAQMGLCVADDQSTVAMLNPKACELLGLDGLATLGQSFGGLLARIGFSPDDAARLAAPDGSGDYPLVIGAGLAELPRHLLLKFSAVHSETRGTYKVVAITDITALMLAQQQVDSEPFRRQWQALNAGVVISDARAPDMPIVFVNAMFEHMSGYASSEILGRNCRFLQGSDTDQPGIATIRDAIKAQSNGFATLRNYRKDGSLFLNQLFISPVRDGAGAVTHFVGIQHPQAPAALGVAPAFSNDKIPPAR
jgi:PAS domain S-box-containing protein